MIVHGLNAQMAWLLTVLIGIAAVLPVTASAQVVDSRTLAGNQTVSWEAPWALNNELSLVGDGFDLLAVESQLGIVGVGSYAFPVAGSEVRDVAIDAFAGELGLRQVDRGDYDNVSYSLDIATSEDVPLGLFTLVVESPTGTLLSLMIAPVQAFQAEMASAQSTITIDGAGVFNGVDAAEMQQRLNVAAPEASQPGQGPTPTPTEANVPATLPPATSAPPAQPAEAPQARSSLVDEINNTLQGGQETPPVPVQPTPAATSKQQRAA